MSNHEAHQARWVRQALPALGVQGITVTGLTSSRLQARVNVKPTAGKPRFGAMPVGQALTGIVLWAGVSCFAVYGFCACQTRTGSYQFGSDECQDTSAQRLPLPS